MNILIIPDVHGREFWIEPCQKWQGFIIFLGDYHDPYPIQVSKRDSFNNLKKLVEFYNSNKHRITCLIGNHDANYLIKKDFADRVDTKRYVEIKEFLKQLDLKLIHIVDDVIFSHSGVLPDWLNLHNIHLGDLKTMEFTDSSLLDISPLRGGYGCEVGSCLWGDVREYAAYPHIPNFYQVFGHTQLIKEPIIINDFADLDVRKCFIMDTKTHVIEPFE